MAMMREAIQEGLQTRTSNICDQGDGTNPSVVWKDAGYSRAGRRRTYRAWVHHHWVQDDA